MAVEEVGDTATSVPASAPLPASTPPLPPSGGGSARIAPPVTSPAPTGATVAAGANDVVSPLSGTVVEIHVLVGQEVQQGDRLITLEAMKMNTAISAARAGGVESIKTQVGESVQEGQVLLTLS